MGQVQKTTLFKDIQESQMVQIPPHFNMNYVIPQMHIPNSVRAPFLDEEIFGDQETLNHTTKRS